MRRAPAHAGSLRVSERLAFVVTFSLMAAFVVGISVLAARSGPGSMLGRSVAASSRTDPAGTQGQRKISGNGVSTPPAASRLSKLPEPQSKALDARLAAALRAALGTRQAQLSVGVTDTATGATALYRPARRYDTGSIAGPDILAALLYQHRQAGTPLSDQDARLAAQMIENGSGAAAARLWEQLGESEGLVAANRALRLRNTIPGPGNAWGLTRTTVADQLQLLASLATSHSALSPADRKYELGLMASVTAAAQRWGVPAAATPGTRYAISDSCLPLQRAFVADSIGVIHYQGHELLVVVLSRDWPAEQAGTSAVRAAAIAAARMMAVTA